MARHFIIALALMILNPGTCNYSGSYEEGNEISRMAVARMMDTEKEKHLFFQSQMVRAFNIIQNRFMDIFQIGQFPDNENVKDDTRIIILKKQARVVKSL